MQFYSVELILAFDLLHVNQNLFWFYSIINTFSNNLKTNFTLETDSAFQKDSLYKKKISFVIICLETKRVRFLKTKTILDL